MVLERVKKPRLIRPRLIHSQFCTIQYFLNYIPALPLKGCPPISLRQRVGYYILYMLSVLRVTMTQPAKPLRVKRTRRGRFEVSNHSPGAAVPHRASLIDWRIGATRARHGVVGWTTAILEYLEANWSAVVLSTTNRKLVYNW